MDSNHTTDSIARTLLYHSIFHYPLSTAEIYRYLISDSISSREQIIQCLDTSDEFVNNGERYSYVTEQPYETRYQERAYQNIQKARELVMYISRHIPNVLTVGVSGSVGALYANEESDIDLFIITKPHTQWIVRFQLLLYLKLRKLHVHTKKNASENAGKYCVNLIVENNQKETAFLHQDLYTAMEIAHLKIVYNKNHAFQQFLLSNSWVNRFLANYWHISTYEWGLFHELHTPIEASYITIKINMLLGTLQRIVYVIRHKTTLTTNTTWVRDYREKTLSEYTTRVRSLHSHVRHSTTWH